MASPALAIMEISGEMKEEKELPILKENEQNE